MSLKMKSLFILLMISVVSISAFANVEISSFKTASNQIVMIGNSLTQLISRTGQSPSSIKTVPWQNKGNTILVLQYDYNIGENIYTVTVHEELIRKIEIRSNLQR